MSTIKVTNIKAADGTSALSIANGTGKVSLATNSDLALQGTGKVFAPNGIVFSSTEITADDASTTNRTESSNLLNDYEEGTWTPTQGGTWSTGLSATGSYTKIGNVVYLFLSVTAGAKTGANGYITGIPFNVSSTLISYYAAGGRGQTPLYQKDAFLYNNNKIYLEENTFANSYDYVFTYRV